MTDRTSKNEIDLDPGEPRLMSGAAWDDFCDALKRAGQRVIGPDAPTSPRDRAEGFRYLARFLAAGIGNCIAHDDARYPVMGRMIDYTLPWGLDNPDCLYLYSGLSGDGRYRIHGTRGSSNHIDVQVNAGHYSEGSVAAVRTLASLDGFDLKTSEDGALEIFLGGPAQGDNHLPLGDDAQFLLIRQYFNAWESEEPAELQIERLDMAGPAAPPSTDWVADHLAKLSRWVENGGALWWQMSQGFLGMPPCSMIVHQPENAATHSGLKGQAYGMGNFHCNPEEAVILSFEPPACHHWGVALNNVWWECIEYASRQSSLNGHQAQLDSDGIFRAVIAHEDPGVPNWLDTAGHTKGTLTARFLRAHTAPEPALSRVPLANLEQHLPVDTPRIGLEERSAQLARRRQAVLRRFRR